jgi:hypothetical protein
MSLFKSRKTGAPQIRVVKKTPSGRILDFTEFMDRDMEQRISSGKLEWMDKVNIFETYYIPTRESEGWVLINGNYKSSNGDDRFTAIWQVGEEVITAKYNDGESTVTEQLKKSKK